MKRLNTFFTLLSFLLLSCTPTSPNPSVPRAPRVVSLSPAMTESLFALGAGANVVGISRYCDYPPEATRLPRVGGFLDPSLEAILALSPTLVVGHRSPANRSVVDTLQSRGIATYFPEQERLAGMFDTLSELGRLTQTQPRARTLIQEINARLDRIATRTAALPKPRVLLLYGLRPLTGAGPNTFADEMITRAGARNALTQGAAYVTLGDEQMIALAPDVIIVSDMGEGSIEFIKEPRFASIPAVAQHRVVRRDDPRMMRPGPRIAEAVALLAQTIHGAAFME